jgi:telomerase reverse transcriptase
MSSLLCSFFYGDLERTHFAHLLADPESMLVRLIDDYMLVTTDLDKARGFLDIMSKGHPEYGCFIAREKTMANFEHRSELLDIVAHQQAGMHLTRYIVLILISSLRFPVVWVPHRCARSFRLGGLQPVSSRRLCGVFPS